MPRLNKPGHFQFKYPRSEFWRIYLSVSDRDPDSMIWEECEGLRIWYNFVNPHYARSFPYGRHSHLSLKCAHSIRYLGGRAGNTGREKQAHHFQAMPNLADHIERILSDGKCLTAVNHVASQRRIQQRSQLFHDNGNRKVR